MNAVENIFVGKEITKFGGFVAFKAMEKRVREVMERYRIRINPLQTIEHMSVADQQFVKILKALMNESRVLIMDEPTSMFNVEDAGKVLDLVRHISSEGIAVIYISHFLKEVVQIADRITVIRDGSVIRTYDNSGRDVPIHDITQDMVGRPVDVFYQKERCEIADVMFEVRDLQLKHDSPHISFSVHRGEILGLSGMVGSGRTEIVRAISGADPCHHMEVLVNGKPVHSQSARLHRRRHRPYHGGSAAPGPQPGHERYGKHAAGQPAIQIDRQGVFYNLRAQAAGVDKIVRNCASKRPTSRRRWFTSPAATSRKSCWESGCTRSNRSISSMSRRAASTSTPRLNSTNR